MEIAKIGIIGGSGLYQMPELEEVEEIVVDTPFGPPSDAFIVGHARKQPGRVSAAPRTRSPLHADRSSLPGKYLRHEVAGR